MNRVGSARSTILAAAVLTALVSTPASAAPPIHGRPQVQVLPVPVPAPSYCSLDTRLFYTLRLGPVAFCRRNLRYRPGALECYQFVDQVCETFDPLNGWVNSRSSVSTQVLPCPAGPEPPVCRALDLPALP